ncbi:GNAT family N-acetyltransferase [soil metagenome]
MTEWIKQRALKNEGLASRTYVVSDESRVVAYYCLAAGSVRIEHAPGSIRRNMPDPIPVVVLGRLAVDRRFERRGLGSALLKDAIVRSLQLRHIAGARALLCHAINVEAGDFYRRFGFVVSPLDDLTLMLALHDGLTDQLA